MRRFTVLLVLVGLLGSLGAAAGAAPEIDPALRRLLPHSGASPTPRSVSGFRSLAAAVGGDRAQVFLRTSGFPLLPAPGLDLVEIDRGFYAGSVELSALAALLETGAVTQARLSRPVTLALDQSTAYLGLAALRRVNLETGTFQGQTGRGVVVGIVDSGLDWLHPDFRRPDGKTRLLRYWDQTASGGRPPAGFPFGSEYTPELLNLGIAGGIDPVGHGTHVLGIAAGNGRASFVPGASLTLAGVAPEADLLAVRTDFTESGVVLGARYIFERARALDRPAVLNLSLGNHFGPHRGTTLFEEALERLVEPGHLIVAAAGNDGARDVHAEMRFAAGETQTLAVPFPPYTKDSYPYLALEGWYPPGERYRITVRNPPGEVAGILEFGDEEAEFVEAKGIVRGWHVGDLGMGTVYIEIADNPASSRFATGTWTVEVDPIAGGSSSEIDWWLVTWGGLSTAPTFASHLDHEETVMSPACSPGILAVGAIATRSCWTDASGEEACYASPPALREVAYFSSLGPTPDGRHKPEILAPGFGVVSARSGGIAPVYATTEDLAHWSLPNGRYYVSQGTSMAAPHVAGTVALLLARYPRLTYEQMKARLLGRGHPLLDGRNGLTETALRTDDALAPVVEVTLAELAPEAMGNRLRWAVGRTRGAARYRIYRGFDLEGPFTLLSSRRIRGEDPYEILDPEVEPGRLHVYRIAAVDEADLEDDLAVLTAEASGRPVPVLRPPEPNPARSPITFRHFVPETGSPSRVSLTLFDVSGRKITALTSVPAGPEGEAMARWDLVDDDGRRVAAGVYFARLEIATAGAPAARLVRRVVVLP